MVSCSCSSFLMEEIDLNRNYSFQILMTASDTTQHPEVGVHPSPQEYNARSKPHIEMRNIRFFIFVAIAFVMY